MAELPHIGKQCSTCNQLDFLPITCHFCKQVFCKDHCTAVTHRCTPENELKKSDIKNDYRKSKNPDDFHRCSHCLDSVSILETVQCDSCNGKFCLLHRHKVDHRCSQSTGNQLSQQQNLDQSERKATVDLVLSKLRTSLGSGVTVKNKGQRNDALALRVATMRLKSIAIGQQSIPLDERLYFYLTFIISDNAMSSSFGQDDKTFHDKPMFFGREWTVGKVIDWIATNCELVNRNNQQLEPKLVLTSAELIMMDKDSKQMSSFCFCCEQKNCYFCFGHQLKQLEMLKTLKNTDKLLITYLKL